MPSGSNVPASDAVRRAHDVGNQACNEKQKSLLLAEVARMQDSSRLIEESRKLIKRTRKTVTRSRTLRSDDHAHGAR